MITNLTRNADKISTLFLAQKYNDICAETIWIIFSKIKFVKETTVHKLLYKRSRDLKYSNYPKLYSFIVK